MRVGVPNRVMVGTVGDEVTVPVPVRVPVPEGVRPYVSVGLELRVPPLGVVEGEHVTLDAVRVGDGTRLRVQVLCVGEGVWVSAVLVAVSLGVRDALEVGV